MEKQVTEKHQSDTRGELSDIHLVLGEDKRTLQSVRSIDITGEKLLDNNDVILLLKISARSLQRYRSTGRIPYYTISGKLYYKLSEVQEFIRKSLAIPLHRTKENRTKQ